MKKILFTGFEPFGGDSVNPSWEAVKLLPDMINGAEIIKSPVCVEYSGSEKALKALVQKHAPDAVVCCGLAGGRKSVAIEMCAINMDHTSAPDNSGEIRLYAPIASDGPAAYFTQAPVEKIVNAVNEKGLACAPSFHAGAYVCNHIYYSLLHMSAREGAPRMGLFIHVPCIPAQTAGKDIPSMELSDIAAALNTAAEVISEAL